MDELPFDMAENAALFGERDHFHCLIERHPAELAVLIVEDDVLIGLNAGHEDRYHSDCIATRFVKWRPPETGWRRRACCDSLIS